MAVLKVEKREGTGKYVAFDMRKQGLIPAVMYGTGMESVNLAVNEHELQMLLVGGSRLIDLDLNGKKQMAILKGLQHATIGKHLLHADFNAIDENTPLHVDVDVELVGDSIGAREGGIVEIDLHALQVECLPRNLPDKLTIDIAKLAIGGVIYVKDVKVPAGVAIKNHADLPVVSCHHANRVVEAAAVVAEAAVAADGKAAPAAAAAAPAKAGAAPAKAAAPAAPAKKK